MCRIIGEISVAVQIYSLSHRRALGSFVYDDNDAQRNCRSGRLAAHARSECQREFWMQRPAPRRERSSKGAVGELVRLDAKTAGRARVVN